MKLLFKLFFLLLFTSTTCVMYLSAQNDGFAFINHPGLNANIEVTNEVRVFKGTNSLKEIRLIKSGIRLEGTLYVTRITCSESYIHLDGDTTVHCSDLGSCISLTSNSLILLNNHTLTLVGSGLVVNSGGSIDGNIITPKAMLAAYTHRGVGSIVIGDRADLSDVFISKYAYLQSFSCYFGLRISGHYMCNIIDASNAGSHLDGHNATITFLQQPTSETIVSVMNFMHVINIHHNITSSLTVSNTNITIHSGSHINEPLYVRKGGIVVVLNDTTIKTLEMFSSSVFLFAGTLTVTNFKYSGGILRGYRDANSHFLQTGGSFSPGVDCIIGPMTTYRFLGSFSISVPNVKIYASHVYIYKLVQGSLSSYFEVSDVLSMESMSSQSYALRVKCGEFISDRLIVDYNSDFQLTTSKIIIDNALTLKSKMEISTTVLQVGTITFDTGWLVLSDSSLLVKGGVLIKVIPANDVLFKCSGNNFIEVFGQLQKTITETFTLVSDTSPGFYIFHSFSNNIPPPSIVTESRLYAPGSGLTPSSQFIVQETTDCEETSDVTFLFPDSECSTVTQKTFIASSARLLFDGSDSQETNVFGFGSVIFSDSGSGLWSLFSGIFGGFIDLIKLTRIQPQFLIVTGGMRCQYEMCDLEVYAQESSIITFFTDPVEETGLITLRTVPIPAGSSYLTQSFRVDLSPFSVLNIESRNLVLQVFGSCEIVICVFPEVNERTQLIASLGSDIRISEFSIDEEMNNSLMLINGFTILDTATVNSVSFDISANTPRSAIVIEGVCDRCLFSNARIIVRDNGYVRSTHASSCEIIVYGHFLIDGEEASINHMLSVYGVFETVSQFESGNVYFSPFSVVINSGTYLLDAELVGFHTLIVKSPAAQMSHTIKDKDPLRNIINVCAEKFIVLYSVPIPSIYIYSDYLVQMKTEVDGGLIFNLHVKAPSLEAVEFLGDSWINVTGNTLVEAVWSHGAKLYVEYDKISQVTAPTGVLQVYSSKGRASFDQHLISQLYILFVGQDITIAADSCNSDRYFYWVTPNGHMNVAEPGDCNAFKHIIEGTYETKKDFSLVTTRFFPLNKPKLVMLSTTLSQFKSYDNWEMTVVFNTSSVNLSLKGGLWDLYSHRETEYRLSAQESIHINFGTYSSLTEIISYTSVTVSGTVHLTLNETVSVICNPQLNNNFLDIDSSGVLDQFSLDVSVVDCDMYIEGDATNAVITLSNGFLQAPNVTVSAFTSSGNSTIYSASIDSIVDISGFLGVGSPMPALPSHVNYTILIPEFFIEFSLQDVSFNLDCGLLELCNVILPQYTTFSNATVKSETPDTVVFHASSLVVKSSSINTVFNVSGDSEMMGEFHATFVYQQLHVDASFNKVMLLTGSIVSGNITFNDGLLWPNSALKNCTVSADVINYSNRTTIDCDEVNVKYMSYVDIQPDSGVSAIDKAPDSNAVSHFGSKQQQTISVFGSDVNDAQYKFEPDAINVYNKHYYIETLKDGTKRVFLRMYRDISRSFVFEDTHILLYRASFSDAEFQTKSSVRLWGEIEGNVVFNNTFVFLDGDVSLKGNVQCHGCRLYLNGFSLSSSGTWTVQSGTQESGVVNGTLSVAQLSVFDALRVSVAHIVCVELEHFNTLFVEAMSSVSTNNVIFSNATIFGRLNVAGNIKVIDVVTVPLYNSTLGISGAFSQSNNIIPLCGMFTTVRVTGDVNLTTDLSCFQWVIVDSAINADIITSNIKVIGSVGHITLVDNAKLWLLGEGNIIINNLTIKTAPDMVAHNPERVTLSVGTLGVSDVANVVFTYIELLTIESIIGDDTIFTFRVRETIIKDIFWCGTIQSYSPLSINSITCSNSLLIDAPFKSDFLSIYGGCDVEMNSLCEIETLNMWYSNISVFEMYSFADVSLTESIIFIERSGPIYSVGIFREGALVINNSQSVEAAIITTQGVLVELSSTVIFKGANRIVFSTRTTSDAFIYINIIVSNTSEMPYFMITEKSALIPMRLNGSIEISNDKQKYIDNEDDVYYNIDANIRYRFVFGEYICADNRYTFVLSSGSVTVSASNTQVFSLGPVTYSSTISTVAYIMSDVHFSAAVELSLPSSMYIGGFNSAITGSDMITFIFTDIYSSNFFIQVSRISTPLKFTNRPIGRRILKMFIFNQSDDVMPEFQFIYGNYGIYSNRFTPSAVSTGTNSISIDLFANYFLIQSIDISMKSNHYFNFRNGFGYITGHDMIKEVSIVHNCIVVYPDWGGIDGVTALTYFKNTKVLVNGTLTIRGFSSAYRTIEFFVAGTGMVDLLMETQSDGSIGMYMEKGSILQFSQNNQLPYFSFHVEYGVRIIGKDTAFAKLFDQSLFSLLFEHAASIILRDRSTNPQLQSWKNYAYFSVTGSVALPIDPLVFKLYVSSTSTITNVDSTFNSIIWNQDIDFTFEYFLRADSYMGSLTAKYVKKSELCNIVWVEKHNNWLFANLDYVGYRSHELKSIMASGYNDTSYDEIVKPGKMLFTRNIRYKVAYIPVKMHIIAFDGTILSGVHTMKDIITLMHGASLSLPIRSELSGCDNIMPFAFAGSFMRQSDFVEYSLSFTNITFEDVNFFIDTLVLVHDGSEDNLQIVAQMKSISLIVNAPLLRVYLAINTTTIQTCLIQSTQTVLSHRMSGIDVQYFDNSIFTRCDECVLSNSLVYDLSQYPSKRCVFSTSLLINSHELKGRFEHCSFESSVASGEFYGQLSFIDSSIEGLINDAVVDANNSTVRAIVRDSTLGGDSFNATLYNTDGTAEGTFRIASTPDKKSHLSGVIEFASDLSMDSSTVEGEVFVAGDASFTLGAASSLTISGSANVSVTEDFNVTAYVERGASLFISNAHSNVEVFNSPNVFVPGAIHRALLDMRSVSETATTNSFVLSGKESQSLNGSPWILVRGNETSNSEGFVVYTSQMEDVRGISFPYSNTNGYSYLRPKLMAMMAIDTCLPRIIPRSGFHTIRCNFTEDQQLFSDNYDFHVSDTCKSTREIPISFIPDGQSKIFEFTIDMQQYIHSPVFSAVEKDSRDILELYKPVVAVPYMYHEQLVVRGGDHITITADEWIHGNECSDYGARFFGQDIPSASTSISELSFVLPPFLGRNHSLHVTDFGIEQGSFCCIDRVPPKIDLIWVNEANIVVRGSDFLDPALFSESVFSLSINGNTYLCDNITVLWNDTHIVAVGLAQLFCPEDTINIVIHHNIYTYDAGSFLLPFPTITSHQSITLIALPQSVSFALSAYYSLACSVSFEYSHTNHRMIGGLTDQGEQLTFTVNNIVGKVTVEVFDTPVTISPPTPIVTSVSPTLLPTDGGIVIITGQYLGDSLFPKATSEVYGYVTLQFVQQERLELLVMPGVGNDILYSIFVAETQIMFSHQHKLSYLPPVLYPPVIGACYTSLRVPLIGANFGPAGTEATARFTYNDWTPSIPVFVLGHRSALAILPPGPDDLCSNPALLETADIRFDVSVGGQTSYSIPAQYSVFPSVEPNNVPCARFASSVTLRVDMSSTGMIPEPRIRLSSDMHISVHTCALDGYLLTCVVPGLVSAEYTGSVQIAGHSEWIALSGRVYAFDVPNQRFIIPIGQEHLVSVKLSHVHTSAIGVNYDGHAMITNTTDEGVAFAHAFSQSGSGIVVTVGDFSVEPSIVFDAVSVDSQTFYMPYGAPYRVSVAATGLHMCRSLVVQVQGIVFLGSFNGATLESDVHVLKTGWSSMHAFCDDVQLYVGEARVFTLDASEIHAFDDAPFSATLCGIGLPPLSLGVCASEACGDCWCFVECVTESLALDPIGIDIPLTRVARPEFSQILWPYGVDHQAKLEPKNPIHSSVSFAMENITFAPSDLALLLGGALYGNTSMRVATPASSYSLSPVTVIKPLLGAILPKKLSMLEDKVIKLTGIHLTEFEGYVLRARYKTTTVYCQLRAGLEFECPFIDPGMYTMDLSTTGGRLFSNGLELQVELPRSELCDTANIPETSRLFELVMNIPHVVALNVALDDARLTDGQRCDVGWSELRREVVDIDREAFVTAISVVLYEPCDVSMVARTANETWVFEPADIVCEQFSSGIMYHELCIMFFDHVRASSFDIELVGCSAVTEVELFGHYVDQVVDLRVVGPMSASIDASSVPLAVAPLNILGRQLAVDQGVLVDGSFVPVANQQLLLSVPKKHGLQCVTVAYSGASTKFCILILAGQAESCAVLTVNSQLVPNTSVPFNVECTDAYGGAASSAVAVECDAGCSFEDSTLILAEPARSNNVTVSSGRFTAITELELMPVPYAAQFFVVRSGIGQPLEIEAHLTDYTDQPVADVGDVAVSTDGVLLHEDSWEAHMGIAIVTTPILNIPLGSNVTVAITANSTKATFELTISDMECPAHSMFVGDACVCSPGYTRRDDVCSACPVGEFKTAEGDVPCASCPSTMISPIAAVSPLQCQCADNYRLVESTCVQCHETVSCANNTISSAMPNHFLEPQATVALTCPSLECDGATCVSARGFMCSMCPNGESIGYDLECTGTKWTPLFHHILATLLLAVLAFAFDTATIAAVGAAALTLPFFGLRFYAINILTLKTPIIIPVAGLVIAYVLLYFAPSRMRSMSTFLVCHMAVALAARTPSLMSTSLSLSLLSPSLFAYAALAATSTHTYLMLRRAKHQVDFTPVIITASVLLLSLVCGTHIVVFGFAAFVTAVLVGLHFFI
ncbi:hypothetical protein PCE1_002448 [Barthelona sp. PCE]